MCPLRMFIARNVGLYLVGGGDPYWNVRSASFVLGQGPRWRWQQGVNCQSFLRVNILWQHHPGSTVNPVLGVNILSFTDEGEFIYVQDMVCLLIGCGNAGDRLRQTRLWFYTLQKTGVERGIGIGRASQL